MHVYVRNTQITKTVIEKQVHEKEEGEKNRNIYIYIYDDAKD